MRINQKRKLMTWNLTWIAQLNKWKNNVSWTWKDRWKRLNKLCKMSIEREALRTLKRFIDNYRTNLRDKGKLRDKEWK